MRVLIVECAVLVATVALLILGADLLLERLLRGPCETPADRWDELTDEEKSEVRRWTKN